MEAPTFDSELSLEADSGGIHFLGCFRTHKPAIDMAGKLGIQEKWWVLAMVSLVFTCEWIDRALLNVALEPMRNDLNLTDTEVGGIASASYWVAVISVLPIGRLADNTSRRDVIACALCIWAFGTVLTGFAMSFTSICLSRTCSSKRTRCKTAMIVVKSKRYGFVLNQSYCVNRHGCWSRNCRVLPCD